jgi:hypothetical protein
VLIVVRIVGLISEWPAAAGARLDADAHDWPNRHGTREKRLDELAKQHHKHCPHDRRPHTVTTDGHTHVLCQPSSCPRMMYWMNGLLSRSMTGNTITTIIILPDSISPPHRRVRPKADVSSIFGCIRATRQHTSCTCSDDDWYYTPRMHAAYARDEI